jgi:hypothetical protein
MLDSFMRQELLNDFEWDDKASALEDVERFEAWLNDKSNIDRLMDVVYTQDIKQRFDDLTSDHLHYLLCTEFDERLSEQLRLLLRASQSHQQSNRSWVIPLSKLDNLDYFPKHEIALQMGILQEIEVVKLNEANFYSKVYFLSHKWNESTPDPFSRSLKLAK